MTRILEIPVEKIKPNPNQPRIHFEKAEITSLADSIKEHGQIQAIAVKPGSGDEFILIDGERRLRAVKLIGNPTIRAEVREDGITPEKQAVLALVANLQRADLNPIEEGKAYQRLVNEFKLNRNQIAQKVGKSITHIHNRLKMLELEEPIQNLIEKGKLPRDPRFVEAIGTVPQGTVRVKLAEALAARGASIKACVEACQRTLEHVRAEVIDEKEIASVRLCQIRRGEINRPVYDALAAVGRIPPWPLVEICARDVCNRCGLRETASITTCNGCTLVEFLVEMIGKVQK